MTYMGDGTGIGAGPESLPRGVDVAVINGAIMYMLLVIKICPVALPPVLLALVSSQDRTITRYCDSGDGMPDIRPLKKQSPGESSLHADAPDRF